MLKHLLSMPKQILLSKLTQIRAYSLLLIIFICACDERSSNRDLDIEADSGLVSDSLDFTSGGEIDYGTTDAFLESVNDASVNDILDQDPYNDGMDDTDNIDSDGDGISDLWDDDPNNPQWPGATFPDTVYAHTADELYALDVKSLSLIKVADFSFDVEGRQQITDIAIDQAGVLWAISFNTLWLCHPQRGECRSKARLPFTNFNGLSFIPGHYFGQERDVLVAADQAGALRRLDLVDDTLVDELIGMYPDERSSGDLFSIQDVGTFASVKRNQVNSDIIVKLDDANPRQLSDFIVLDGYQAIYGLAGWRGKLFAFDESGAVILVDLETRQTQVLSDQRIRWWGAGVSSVLRER